MFLLKESDNPATVVRESSQVEPYLVVLGTETEPKQIFLGGEKMVFMK
jgi:hypothetical protein